MQTCQEIRHHLLRLRIGSLYGGLSHSRQTCQEIRHHLLPLVLMIRESNKRHTIGRKNRAGISHPKKCGPKGIVKINVEITTTTINVLILS